LRLAVEHTFQTGQARHNVERRLRLRGDGQEREVDLLGSTAPVHTSGRDCVLLCLNDVTAHRRADEALRSARQFTDDLIETANSIIVGLDASGNVTIFNRAAERATGYTRSELAGRNWFEVLVPRERYPQVWAEFNRLLAGGMPRNFENPILTRSGEERHILWQNTEVREAGRVIGSVSFGLDITDRKAAEEAIRESEERFRVLVESAPEAIFVQSEGRFVYLNPPMLSLLGASRPEQLIGSEFLDRVAPEFHEAIRERIRFQIATGRSAPPMEQDYIRLDGTRVPVETAAVAIRYQGRDAHLVFVRDMSERKRAEEERALAERRLSLHVQQTPLAVIEFALDGTVREWNPAAERIFGYSRAEAVGQHWTFIVPCSIWNRLDGTWDQIVTQRGGGRSSNENVTKAGGIIQCEWFNTPLTTASGKTIGVASLIMEVTEQRQNEAILQSRLRLVEFAESHSLRDLLRKTLDEVEALTGSSVGFLHFFEADKQWLSLGVWSTRTVTESCRAARDAMHYPLTQAGAWADCVRQGGPVVCNDYRGMADRKGTPPGHADIVRFVSVPVFRGRAIKAVLGVGNKASNYDDRDVAVISRFADFAWDIAERRRSEDERAITLRLLRAASVPGSLRDLARDVLEILREWSGCDAVGLRLRDGDDYPYCETAGFAEGFVRAENHLCVRDAATAVVRDSSGNPVLECMCGNVLCGRFDPNRPFFTEGGSFWTGSTSELLTSTTEADRQARTRNRCHGEGFESVALVPLRVAGQTLGLLQFNDRRRGRVTRQMVSDAERLAARLAISLAQRQTADALQKSEEQLRLALRAGDLGIWEWDLVTGQVVCSERLAQLHGLTDLRGPFETFASRVHPDDLPGLLTAVDRARRTRSYYTHEYRVVWPDGSVHWLRGRGGCEYDGDGNPLKMRGVTVDNTEWRRAQAFLVSSEKMASVGRLAAGLAHEINNPLAGMLQNAQVVLNRVSDGSPANEQIAREAGTSLSAVREYLERRGVPEMLRAIRASGQRAAEIVANMLSFSRKSDEQLVPRDMRELLDRTFDLACAEYDPRYSLDLRAIDVVREYEPGLPPVPCVASEIQQVLLNLFRNAAQAMRERGQRPDPPRLVLRARRQNDTVAIEVEDNGPGMTEEVRHHVFEPFHTTKGPREGTGLGLFVSYAIITRNHHGSITVDTAPGRGTTFTIVLPLNSGGAV
jgi:PAS domain S-box-containing protein